MLEDDESSQLRAMNCELGLLSRSDGAAYFSQGDTSVMAAVYGPAEVRISKELVDKATVDVVYKQKVGLPGCVDKFQEAMIRNTCESVILTTLHPRTSINVILQEQQNSGSLLSCCINAASLALLDAGVPMRWTVAAVTCILDEQRQIHLDPTMKQQATAAACLTFAFDSSTKGVITSTARGCFEQTEYQACLLACQKASESIFDFYRDAMKRKLSRESSEDRQ